MRSMLVVLPCLLLSAPAVAQTIIYRCKAADGVVAVQSEPCTAAQRDLGARYYDTGSASPDALQRRRQADAEIAARNRQQERGGTGYWSHGGSLTDQRDQQRAQCESARENRDRTLKALGLNRSFDTLRALNEAVQQACRGL